MPSLWKYTQEDYISLVDVLRIRQNGIGTEYLLEVKEVLQPGWFGGIQVGKRFVAWRHSINRSAWILKSMYNEKEDNGKTTERNTKRADQKRFTTVIP